MPHRHPRKSVHHVKPNYKRLALIAATAAVLTTTTLPGMSTPLAQASANTFSANTSATTSQQIEQTNTSSTQLTSMKKSPPKNMKHPKQTNKSARVTKNTSKIPVISPVSEPKPIEKNKVTQPNQNNTKPEATTKKTPNQVKEHPTSSRNTPPNHYKEVLDISATAYAPGPHDNEQWGNKTYIGTEVRPGIIAVDPKLIPLGSRVYIEYPDGRGEYATAEDTGGAIKGNRIDIAKQTVSEAEDFGIQNVKVYVVSTPKNA